MRTLTLIGLLALAARGTAGEVPVTADQLAASLRTLLLAGLPDPVIDKRKNWGHQKLVANGVTWRKSGLVRKPVVQKKMKNDGTWRHHTASVINPQDTLQLAVRNLQSPAPKVLLFEIWVACDVSLFYEQQVWKRGRRLYSGSTRGRCKVVIGLLCEAASRLEKGDGLLPTPVLTLRVKKADFNYTGLHVTHVLGFGGDGADLVGRALEKMIKQWKPGLRRDLLSKANAAILKAGKAREVRLGFSQLLGGE